MEIDTSSQIPVFRSLGFQQKKERAKYQKLLILQKEEPHRKQGRKNLLLQKSVKKTIMTG